MKNKLLNFIDLLIFFFNQGYSLQETLDFCSLLNYEKEVKEIKNYLNQGFSLDEIFIMLPFPTLFKEYYSFFKNEFTLETALKKSIEICYNYYKSQRDTLVHYGDVMGSIDNTRFIDTKEEADEIIQKCLDLITSQV